MQVFRSCSGGLVTILPQVCVYSLEINVWLDSVISVKA